MKLFFREIGQGKPLLILHGLWGASENWLPVAHLLQQQFRIILPDIRNHGQSPHAEEMNYQAMSDDIIELIHDLHLPCPPSIVGHSMGGKILMTLLLKQPELVDKPLVVDIAPLSYSSKDGGSHNKIIHFMGTFDLSRYSSWTLLKKAIQQYFPTERGQQLFLKNIRKTSSSFQWKINHASIGRHFDEISGNPPAQPHASYDKDITFVKGEYSHLIPGLECLQTQFPAARLIQIPGCGHWIHSEQPEKLAEIIKTHC